MTKKHQEELQKAIQEMYNAAKKVDEISTEEDYDLYTDVLDEAANVINEVENTFPIEEGVVIVTI